MKNQIFICCVILVAAVMCCHVVIKSADAEYSFEVVSAEYTEDKKDSVEEKDDTVEKNMAAAKEIYQNIKESGTDLSILEGQLSYNLKREQVLMRNIENLEKKLGMLPKAVKKGYVQIEDTMKNAKEDISNDAWLTFNDVYVDKKVDLERRLGQLNEDLVKVRGRIDKLNLETDSLKALSSIDDPFADKRNKESKIEFKAQKVKDSLKVVVDDVTNKEMNDLLKETRYEPLDLCKSDCGDCYLCNLIN